MFFYRSSSVYFTAVMNQLVGFSVSNSSEWHSISPVAGSTSFFPISRALRLIDVRWNLLPVFTRTCWRLLEKRMVSCGYFMFQHGEHLRNVPGSPQIEKAQRSYLLKWPNAENVAGRSSLRSAGVAVAVLVKGGATPDVWHSRRRLLLANCPIYLTRQSSKMSVE